MEIQWSSENYFALTKTYTYKQHDITVTGFRFWMKEQQTAAKTMSSANTRRFDNVFVQHHSTSVRYIENN